MGTRLAALMAAATLTVVACSQTAPDGGVVGSSCGGRVVEVVASVDQWGDIAQQLGGECAQVTTAVANSSIDPHDFEPTPSDLAAFDEADLVVVNGAGYDAWASGVVEALPAQPDVVDAAVVNRVSAGANPHLWYSPEYVAETARAITRQLSAQSPDAAGYFAARQAAWTESMRPYYAEIARIRKQAAGKPFGATEPLFDYMADALGLVNRTPAGYRRSSANEGEPSPGDLKDFKAALEGHQMAVLIFNSQVSGAVPEMIERDAREASVPVVAVTETVVPGASSFADWQVSQLRALAGALGVRG
ncbi:MAG: zinc ABC transporter substrate-binding protein [Candidatus Nanopelagicales bacterium]|nr:zinc ABC transporter substrate-binding protein [Candidatus Nanopelagicales bacterium]MDZ4248734.1 zinc ABC transporter substrate-binding protein [Candidatus Nanopelagicales bacterium]